MTTRFSQATAITMHSLQRWGEKPVESVTGTLLVLGSHLSLWRANGASAGLRARPGEGPSAAAASRSDAGNVAQQSPVKTQCGLSPAHPASPQGTCSL